MNSFVASWRPAQVRLAPAIGQQVSNPPGTIVVPARPAFIDSPVVQFVTDTTAAISTGILGYTFGKTGSRWSTVFWMLTAVTGFKAFYDLSKLNR